MNTQKTWAGLEGRWKDRRMERRVGLGGYKSSQTNLQGVNSSTKNEREVVIEEERSRDIIAKLTQLIEVQLNTEKQVQDTKKKRENYTSICRLKIFFKITLTDYMIKNMVFCVLKTFHTKMLGIHKICEIKHGKQKK